MSEEKSFDQMIDESIKTIRTGEIVDGTVISVKPDEIVLNIGYKSDGIITKGDMNDSPDPDPVTRDKYIGKTLFALPYGGRLLGFAQSLAGKIAIALGGVLLLLLGCFYKSE